MHEALCGEKNARFLNGDSRVERGMAEKNRSARLEWAQDQPMISTDEV
jgi:hypothetical protein